MVVIQQTPNRVSIQVKNAHIVVWELPDSTLGVLAEKGSMVIDSTYQGDPKIIVSDLVKLP